MAQLQAEKAVAVKTCGDRGKDVWVGEFGVTSYFFGGFVDVFSFLFSIVFSF